MYKNLLSKELEAKQDDFAEFADTQAKDADHYLASLFEVAATKDARERLFAATSPGAVPSEELNENPEFHVPFAEAWSNHEEARAWASDVLSNRKTFAADGSQVYVQKETSLPVGAVQIGWFENPHDPGTDYEKGAEFELLTPRDLLENQEEPLNPESRIGERRFHKEVDRIMRFMRDQAGWESKKERVPVAFLDGTILVSFSQPQTMFQQGFVEKLFDLVSLSAEVRVPVVGYVDRSFAKDIVAMIRLLGEISGATSLYDATLLSTATSKNNRVLERWGDRSVFCFSKRKGLEKFLDIDSGKPLVGFTYLQTSRTSAPARLDLPAWVYNEGLAEEVIDVVRAECVVGLGYPYALETADATALISSADRELFLNALREFAVREGLNLSVSRKAASKARRR